MKKVWLVFPVLMAVLVLAAQHPPTNANELYPTQAESGSGKDLVVCQSQEPITLYRYGASQLGTTAVLHAIYENNYTNLGFDHQPVGLEKIPSLADDDAIMNSVTVSTNDLVVDANGDIVSLEAGMSIIDADGDLIVFNGTPVQMSQLVVTFTMKQRFWSDGMPVTADDSLYSFTLEADLETPGNKYLIHRTASYTATDSFTTQWTGLPGFLDDSYFTHFWPPLPRHAWEHLTAAQLLTDTLSTQMPLGDGPFKIVAWHAGDSIRLEPNEFYYRADEGLPYLDSVTFRFISDANQVLEELLAGACHIATTGTLGSFQVSDLLAAEAQGLLSAHLQTGTAFEHIDFGINSYGEYGDGIGRPDWFESALVRRAMVLCTDRQRMVNEILYGRSQIAQSYIHATHPLYPGTLPDLPYDVATANAFLDEAGYLDTDNDGIREDFLSGQPFAVTLGAANNEQNQQYMEIFKENMRDCGIDVTLSYLPASEWFAPGPDGPLFGRQFDLGAFAWLSGIVPPCDLWLGENITGPLQEGLGGWDNVNVTGWDHAAFNEACHRARKALPGQSDYVAGHQEAACILFTEMPIIPLYYRLKISATRPEVLNYYLDTTQNSDMYNLYEIDLLPPGTRPPAPTLWGEAHTLFLPFITRQSIGCR